MVFSIFVFVYFAMKMNRKEERMVVQRVRAMENTGMKQTKSVCELHRVACQLHLFCKNARFQNFFGCLEGKALLRLMLIDELLFLKGKTKLQKRRTIKRRLQNR